MLPFRHAVGRLETAQVFERTIWSVEDEREHVLAVLLARPDEALQVRLVRDTQGHVSARAAHLELQVSAALSRDFGQVERDVGERELERDLLVLHGAAAE